MKNITTLRKTLKILATSALALSVVAFGTGLVNAIGEGQIERGDIYYSRNITKNSAFGDPTAADKCNTLQYKIRMHNPGASPVTNVRIKVDLPATASTTNVSTATITANNAFPATVSDTATVNLSSAQKITYKAGTTELLNANNAVISALPDGITAGSGIDIGSVGVSINEIRFVQFKADVDCPQVPCTPPNPECTPPQIVSSGICKMLDLVVTNREKREVKATVTGEVNNATILGYKIDFGDGATSAQQSDTHMYAKDGTFIVTGQVQIRLADNTVVTRESVDCKKQVTFKADVVPEIVTPPATPVAKQEQPQEVPASLPATGPAGVGLIATAVSGVSSLGYYLVSAGRRKFFN